MNKHSRINTFFERWTLRSALMVFSITIVGVMTFLLVSVFQSTSSFYRQLDRDLNRLVELQLKIEAIEIANNDIRSYTLSGDIIYLNAYKKNIENLNTFFSNALEHAYQQDNYFMYLDLSNIFMSFTEQATISVEIFESDVSSVYVNQQFFQTSKNMTYVQIQLGQIISQEIIEIRDKYGDIERLVKVREEMIYFIVFMIITLTLVSITFIAKRLAAPIHELSLQLKQIAGGVYDREAIKPSGIGEIRIMIGRFNKMKVKLADHIDVIHESALMREQLKNQEIALLASENYLKQSRLDFLQSQINPHFLYNTLNSIQTLADIEDAPQTEKMLFHMSSLIRYSLKKVNDVVSLNEELEIVKSYIYIQMIRFGNKIQYEIEEDKAALHCQVPSMILQPLVENAMNHGLEPKMGQGKLMIKIKKVNSHIEVSVYDNGTGMSQEKISSIMNHTLETHNVNDKGVQSIGMMNVIRRCLLYYGQNIVSINSQEGVYTEVKLTIPDNK